MWLNEAFATYMSAAYNEYRFGSKKYEQNIKAYYDVYEKIKAKGADKPLVFNKWTNPTADDRNLVYFKGAYVLHLLREEVGEENFWKGIHHYSRLYYGKWVLTKDFQQAMENSSSKDLSQFFDKWVYNK
jgi:aminopeptidase N